MNVENRTVRGAANPCVKSMAYDSRDVKKDGLFFALKGIHVDGHEHIDEAVQAGASVIVHSKYIESRKRDITYVRVPDTRVAMSPISAAFWDYPSRKLTIIGVTGTDGKSTTVSLIRQLLEFSGSSAGSLSTVDFTIGGKIRDNFFRQSTPEAVLIHKCLNDMLEADQKFAVLEATSHGLSPKNSRLEDVDFDAAVLTNISSEHLDFHGDLETYRNDKSRLFQMIADSGNLDAFGVVNADDIYAELFVTSAGEKPVFTYSLRDEDADLHVSAVRPDPTGTSFILHTPFGYSEARINMPGIFNLENLLAALCTVSELQEIDPLDFVDCLPKLTGVAGRMKTLDGNMDYHVMVDYAHSPGSFSKVLPFLKNLTSGKLMVVFGSAGERDREKRPELGKIASDHGDILFLTDEDPRGEDSMSIINDIAGGVKGKTQGEDLFLIPDRREAIRKSFIMARQGDLVVTLGKGHEKSIVYAAGPQPWDEFQVCREILQELGYKTE